jgi:proteic killer suppression protein
MDLLREINSTRNMLTGKPQMFKDSRRKLRQLEIAGPLEDLRVPPGNHLGALKGDRSGQYSIRINNQWCVCFRWTDAGAENVEIIDYH